MRKFNLEEFKEKKVAITRDGFAVRYLGLLEGQNTYPLICAFMDEDGDENCGVYSLDGIYFVDDDDDDERDLFMPAEKRYVNLYINKADRVNAGYPYKIEAEAKKDAPMAALDLGIYIKTVEIDLP